MLRDSIQSSNKYFKVLYGPLDHVFYINLHNRPSKQLVLFDDNYRQIRNIDISHVSSFQSRCIHSDSTVNVKNRKQTVVTTKYLLEIYFGSTNRNPLTFTTVSYSDCQALCSEIEKVFGVRVYNYGSLNAAFKNALKNVNEDEFLPERHDDFATRLKNHQLYKDAHDLRNLCDLIQFESDEQTEPLAEFSANFPVVIEGDMEDGSFVCYRDIRTRNNLNSSVYKVEWYLSKSVGSADEFFEGPSETSDTFYLNEYMVGHFVMVKVFRALKFNDTRTFVFSTAQRGPITPNTLLCHHILINSSKKSDFHDTLISTLDLDVLFKLVDKSSKFGVYEPFNKPDVVNNFEKFQKFFITTDEHAHKSESRVPVAKAPSKKDQNDDDESEKVFRAETSDVVDPPENEDGNEKFEEAAKELNEVALNVGPDPDVEIKAPKFNNIRLKAPSRRLGSQDSKFDDEGSDEVAAVNLDDLDEADLKNLKILYGNDLSNLRGDPNDLHETTTVSDISDSRKLVSFAADAYAQLQPQKKRFSLFNVFRSKNKPPKQAVPKPPMRAAPDPKKAPKGKNVKEDKKSKKPEKEAKKPLLGRKNKKGEDQDNDPEFLEDPHAEIPDPVSPPIVKAPHVVPKAGRFSFKKGNNPPVPDNQDKKLPKAKKVVYTRKYEKQMKANAKAPIKKQPTPIGLAPESDLPELPEVDHKQLKGKLKDNKGLKGKGKPPKEKEGNRLVGKLKGQPKAKDNVKAKGKKGVKKPTADLLEDYNEVHFEQHFIPQPIKAKKGLFGSLKKMLKPKTRPQKKYPVPNNELLVKKEQGQVDSENFERFRDTMQFVPVKLRISLNELIITFGLCSLSLKWKSLNVEKADQLANNRFPSMQKQLENRVTLVYKSSTPIRISLRTQSTFQRNVIFHSILFNKFRTNYSIDRCERELESGYYNGIKAAYSKVCIAHHEYERRNQEQETELTNAVNP